MLSIAVLLLSLCLLWKGGWKIYAWWDRTTRDGDPLPYAVLVLLWAIGCLGGAVAVLWGMLAGLD